MAVSVTLPELGESVAEGTVTRWLKNVGETVAQDEPLVEIATDKVDTEIPSPVSGVIVEICAWEDDTIPIGGLLARIADPSEAAASLGSSFPAEEPTAAIETMSEPAMVTAEEAEEGNYSNDVFRPPFAFSDDANADTNADVEDCAVDRSNSDEGDVAKSDDAGEAQYFEVLMPELGESVAEGTITRWCKKLGEEISEDEPLLEVSTDKVDTEIPSPANGIIVQICALEDDTIPVGQVLAVLQVGGTAPDPADLVVDDDYQDESYVDTAEESEESASATMQESTADSADTAAAESFKVPQTVPDFGAVSGVSGFEGKARASTDHSYVTPLVRKLAEEKGVDLEEVTGSGLGGRILKKDIIEFAAEQERHAAEAAAAAAASTTTGGAAAGTAASLGTGAVLGAAGALGSLGSAQDGMDEDTSGLRGTVRPASPVRQSTARAALAAARNTAQVSQVTEVDLTTLLRQLVSHSSAEPSLALSLRACFAYVVARVLRRHPVLNASYDQQKQEIAYHQEIDLSVGVDTPQGLLSPVLHQADHCSLAEIAELLQGMEERCLSGNLTPGDLSGGTFTLAHPGSTGALWEIPIVTPPQSAALAVGNPVQRPMVVEDAGGSAIAIRAMSYVTLSYDACLIDAPAASRFLRDLQHTLQDASFLDDIDDVNILP